jgi:signal peptidase I
MDSDASGSPQARRGTDPADGRLVGEQGRDVPDEPTVAPDDTAADGRQHRPLHSPDDSRPAAATADSHPVAGSVADSDDAEQLSPAARRWREIEAKRARKAKRSFWVELPILLLVAFVMTFVIQTFLFKVYYIPSPSMEKTLHGVSEGGDRVLVNKIVYRFAAPAPGEVVVFSGPPSWAAEANIPGPSTWYGKFFQAVGSVVGIAPPNEKDFVKRVIATGGQTVQCCDSAGNVMVNGKALTEPYIYQNFPFRPGVEDCTSEVESERCFGPVTVPDGSVWMMGDHRLVSKDSAFGCRHGLPVTQCQGPVPVDNVIGHAIAIVMPVSRWSGIGSPDIQGAAVIAGLLPLARTRGRHRHRLPRGARWHPR